MATKVGAKWSNGRRKGAIVERKTSRRARPKTKTKTKRGGCPRVKMSRTRPPERKLTMRVLQGQISALAARTETIMREVAVLMHPPVPDLPGRWNGVGGMQAINSMGDGHLLSILAKAVRDPLPTDESRFGQIVAVAVEAGRRGLVQG